MVRFWFFLVFVAFYLLSVIATLVTAIVNMKIERRSAYAFANTEFEISWSLDLNIKIWDKGWLIWTELKPLSLPLYSRYKLKSARFSDGLLQGLVSTSRFVLRFSFGLTEPALPANVSGFHPSLVHVVQPPLARLSLNCNKYATIFII